jgi:hypothetical protein
MTRRTALLFVLLALLTQARETLAEAAARMEFAIGTVRVLDRDAATRVGRKALIVYSGETVVTGPDSRVGLRFSDGGFFALAPDSRFRIDDYQYAGVTTARERSYVTLLKGAMRAITGAIGRTNHDNFRLNTSEATIGVRGTEYSVRVGARLLASVSEGEIVLCNDGGCRSALRGEAYSVHGHRERPGRVSKQQSTLPFEPSQGTAAQAGSAEH